VGSFGANKKQKKAKPPAVFSGFLRPLQKKKKTSCFRFPHVCVYVRPSPSNLVGGRAGAVCVALRSKKRSDPEASRGVYYKQTHCLLSTILDLSRSEQTRCVFELLVLLA
jgi:hypothetical protein